MSRLWLIPGHQDAATSNMLPRDQWGQRTESIRSVLQEIHSDFDFCIIDTPPNLHLCTYAAIRAADHVVVPLAPEDFGAQGLVAVGRAIRSVAIEHGSPLVLGYLLSLFDQRLSIHHAYADRLTEIYGGLVFSTRVPLLSAYKEAVAARKPISHFRPRSPAGKVFESLADEIQQRLAIGVVAA
jgi:chromosome partitioning protein